MALRMQRCEVQAALALALPLRRRRMGAWDSGTEQWQREKQTTAKGKLLYRPTHPSPPKVVGSCAIRLQTLHTVVWNQRLRLRAAAE